MRERPQLNVDMGSVRSSQGERNRAQKSRSDSEFWAKVLPMVGTGLGAGAGALIGGIPTGGIGALPGAGIGASIGGALGGAAGAGFQNQADSADDEINQKEMRQQALMNALMSMRR